LEFKRENERVRNEMTALKGSHSTEIALLTGFKAELEQ